MAVIKGKVSSSLAPQPVYRLYNGRPVQNVLAVTRSTSPGADFAETHPGRRLSLWQLIFNGTFATELFCHHD